MRKIIWSKNAISKLKECLGFWTEHNQSNLFSLKIEEAIINAEDTLKIFPFIGRTTDKKDIRRLLVMKRFILFYKVSDTTISILAFKEAEIDL